MFGKFYSQDTGETMGSPLVVELADIGVADVENTALNMYKDPPNNTRLLLPPQALSSAFTNDLLLYQATKIPLT